MRRGLIAVVAVGLAVIVQLTLVNRIAFPGGSGPDVVLLAVAALALATGPLAGSVIGFTAGLALDVAPPGSHFVGQDALVFCLIGYACGLAADPPVREGVPEQGHTALFEILVTALAAVAGEALGGLLGAMLSDPRATWPAIKHVLPIAALYDVLLCPFALYAVAAALRLAGASRQARMPAPSLRAASGPGGLPQVTPRLRLSERGRGDGLAGLPASGVRTLPRREPKLKLGRGGPAPGRPLGAAFTGGGAAKVRFSSGRGAGFGSGRGAGFFSGRGAGSGRGGVLGGSLLGGTSALNSSLARSRLHGSRFGPSRMGRSLLGGSVFSRAPSALRSPAAPRESALPGWSSLLGRSSLLGGRSPFLAGRSPFLGGQPSLLGRPGLRRRTVGQLRSPGGSAAGFAPRLSRPGVIGRLNALLRGPAGRQPRLRQSAFRSGQSAFRQPVGQRSPGRGWLRGSSRRLGGGRPRRGWLGGGWLGGGRLGGGQSRRGFAAGRRMPGLGAAPARLHMRRSRFGGSRLFRRWRTGGYR